MTRLSYKDAGVDIDAGNALVEAIKPLAKATARPGVASGLGGFGAMFDLKGAGFEDPILVAGTDGVGTKLKIAIATGKHDTVGIDLVAMCANDLVVQGAEPLFFLDYFATGALDVDAGKAIVSGIAEGCRQAGCALIGGETAEMPGMYEGGDYDLAGFCVGAVERDAILTGDRVKAGDVLLGIESSGVHSNGFSLVRKVLELVHMDYDHDAPFAPGKTIGECLLVPTRMYVKACLAGIRAGGVHALAHITGGGLVENVPRVLPDGLGVEIDASTWTVPEIFRWLARAGGIQPSEMERTFNCGIGMVAAVAPDKADAVLEAMRAEGETAHRIGTVVEHGSGPQVAINGLDSQWHL